MNKTVGFQDWGLIDYKEAWDKQELIFKGILDLKMANRKNEPNVKQTPNHLIFCEHPHVYTLGKSGDEQHLLLNKEGLEAKGATYYKINRGGDITYHGPGQIVGYPIIDLENFFTDIHKYLRCLEEAVILTLAEYGIASTRLEGLTGVWLDADNPAKARKICAMGVKCSRWVTMHGFAFNVNANLDYFNNIVPCGITDKAVTSMEKELGEPQDMKAVQKVLIENLCNIFDFDLRV
ncbi:MAG: lipoyl(octanoyl) transferase [Sphingobacteriales bacterium]|jgi:lipoyl(octanoyl) transferase